MVWLLLASFVKTKLAKGWSPSSPTIATPFQVTYFKEPSDYSRSKIELTLGTQVKKLLTIIFSKVSNLIKK